MELKLLNSNLIKFIILVLCILPTHGYSREIEDVFKSMTSIKDPLGARDPFQPPKIQRPSTGGSKATTPQRDGVYSNIPVLGNVPVNEIRIVGVIIGPERRAFIKKAQNDPTTYILREGDKLGGNDAEVKAILPGGVILVEKVTNIYGEEEFLETVIPLSQ